MFFSKVKIISFILIIIFDQIIKIFIKKIFPDIIVINYHGTLGILPPWIALIGLVAVFFLIIEYKQDSIWIYFILAAGISNILDRFIYSGVIDYIHLFFIPTFNLADFIITLSTIMLIKQSLWKLK